MNTPEVAKDEQMIKNREGIEQTVNAIEALFTEIQPLPYSDQAKSVLTIMKLQEVAEVRGNKITFHLSKIFEV